jgi:hypothetical protein
MKPLLALACLAGCLTGQDRAAVPSPQRMEVRLERLESGSWKGVDPGFVFGQGDYVRFLFRANFAGHLYVMDLGTSGRYSLLFPREETGSDNHVEAGREYLIPATGSRFRVAGPAGHDVIYWLMSPLPLPGAADGVSALPKEKQPPKTLLPRCDESIFRARGLCIDSSAGLRAVPQSGELPENLRSVPLGQSRELIIMRRDDSSVVSSAVPLNGPVIYEFLLAHK